jgi:hypothetical protein
MKMKPHEKSLGRNPLSDAPCRNPGMVLNGQGPGRHPLGDTPYLDLDTVLNEQESDRRILSDALLETELSLSSRGRMTLGVGAIFLVYCSHSTTMSCPPRGWGYILIGC